MDVTLAYKGEQTFELKSRDKDGQDNSSSCKFSASASDPEIVRVALSGSSLRLVALAAGETKVTVRAENTSGAEETEFNVNVLLSPPVAIEIVPPAAVEQEGPQREPAGPEEEPEGEPEEEEEGEPGEEEEPEEEPSTAGPPHRAAAKKKAKGRR